MNFLQTRELSLDQLMPLVKERLTAGYNVRFLPKGTSMLPMLRQGKDSVTLSPLVKEPERYDLILYQRDNGQYVLHRIIKAGTTYTCMGDNQFEPERDIRREQMIAVVTMFTRNGKKHSVQEKMFRLYCRIWHYSRPVRKFWRSIRKRFD